jgi:hypothetical protein
MSRVIAEEVEKDARERGVRKSSNATFAAFSCSARFASEYRDRARRHRTDRSITHKCARASAMEPQRTFANGRPRRWQPLAFAALWSFCLLIPSNWTQDVPARYGKRHPGLTYSWLYPQLDTSAHALR